MQKVFSRSKTNSKKLLSIMLAIVMAVSLGASTNMTASAAWINNNFTLSPGGYNRGNDRYYDGNYMAYEIVVTDASGKSSNTAQIFIQLRSYSDGVIDQRYVKIKDGRVKVDWIPIMDGGCYYFTYRSVVTGTGAGKVGIDMTIYSWY